MKKICGLLLFVILCISVMPVCAEAEVDYKQIYMDFAKYVDENYDNPLQNTSGLIMLDLNRDNVPELFSYRQSDTRYDIDGNPISMSGLDPDAAAYAEYEYWFEDAFSIVDGEVKVGTPWENLNIHFPHLPDAELYDYVGACTPAQHGIEDCLVVSNPIEEGHSVYTAIKYENGVFSYTANNFDESFYDVYYFVDLPVCSAGYYDDKSKQRFTKSEAMEALLNNYSEKVKNMNNTSEWAKETIQQAKEIGLMPQEMIYDDLSQNITREEFAGIAITLLENITGREYQIRGGNPFEDVKSYRYYDYITKAYKASIVSGVSATEFEPFMMLTREQLATMLCRVIKSAENENYRIENDADFSLDVSDAELFADDATISDFAKESVYYMNKMQIAKGVGDNRFAPQDTATREEAIALALRVYNLYANK